MGLYKGNDIHMHACLQQKMTSTDNWRSSDMAYDLELQLKNYFSVILFSFDCIQSSFY